jgi:cytochrome P450
MLRDAFMQTALDLRPGTFSRRKAVCETINASNITGVFTQNGETWKRHRRLTSPAFSRPNVASVVPKINAVAKVLVDKWSKRSAGGTGEPLCDRCL